MIIENDENPLHVVASEDLEKDEEYKKVEDDNKVEDVVKFKNSSLDNVDHDTADLAHD